MAHSTIVPNPFPPVPIMPEDREALFGGLISAGHPIEYARSSADTLPDNDASLQMLARHRLAYDGTVVRKHPYTGIDIENAAWNWLDKKFANIERGDDPVDRAYDASEMVDAFHAGAARGKPEPEHIFAPAGLVDQFRAAVSKIDFVAERFSSGQQFNAYESACSEGDDDDDIGDDDRDYCIAIGPITDARYIISVEGKQRADLIESALKLAQHIARPAATAGEVEEGEASVRAHEILKAVDAAYASYMGDPEGRDDIGTAKNAAALVIDAALQSDRGEVERLRRLVERAQLNMPEFYVNWHADARVALGETA